MCNDKVKALGEILSEVSVEDIIELFNDMEECYLTSEEYAALSKARRSNRFSTLKTLKGSFQKVQDKKNINGIGFDS